MKWQSLKKVYNNSILTGDIQNMNIKIGGIIVFKKPKGHFPRYKKCKIQELQINGQPHKTINETNSTGIGIKVDEEVKDNCRFRIMV